MKIRKIIIVTLAMGVVALLVIHLVCRNAGHPAKQETGQVLVAKQRSIVDPQWSQDGARLYYLDGNDFSKLYSYNLASGSTTTNTLGTVHVPYGVS